MAKFVGLPTKSAATALFLGVLPHAVIALDIGAGIGLGGSSVGVGASVGSSGASAGATASLGDTRSSADVGIGLIDTAIADVNATIGTGAANTQPVAPQAAAASEAEALVQSFVGLILISSDNVPLGRVVAAEMRTNGSLHLRIAISDYLRSPAKTAKVVFQEMPRMNGNIRLGMTAERFIATL